jgi:hypothetical protein
MGTAKKSKYDKDEDKLISHVEHMLEHYGINKSDIFDIIKDRVN